MTPSALRSLVDEFLLYGGVNVTEQHFHLMPLGAAQRTKQTASPLATPAPLSRYLSDLRDDLALHAPIPWNPDLSDLENANRRWQYAEVMLATRTTQDGD